MSTTTTSRVSAPNFSTTTTTTTTTTTSTSINDALRDRTRRAPLTSPVRPQSPHDWVRREGHGRGETAAQHAAHSTIKPIHHFGLAPRAESLLCWTLTILGWGLLVSAAVLGSLYKTYSKPFIGTIVPAMVLHSGAWLQTVTGMLQRASWVRDESNLQDRREFLVFAVRLNRQMMPTAVVSLAVFIQAYVRRHTYDDLAYWLIYLLIFIFNTVASVMNAYNNITWENDRLNEEGEIVYTHTRLAVLGIPS